jgi:FKBP-type peptidyl-prolyl cis-trans isomerase
MKKYLLLFSVVLLGLSACKKSDVTVEQATADDNKIQAYIAANYKTNTFTKDPSGLYYSVVTLGAGAYPTASSTVQVNYTGKYLNGAVFTQTSSTVNQQLSQTIMGWQIGLLHIKARDPNVSGNTGGRIILIIPSGLAYGTTGNETIPANSVLIYTIDLIGIAS